MKTIPVIPIGHSAAASAPYNFGVWNPSRTLACISVSGQLPYATNAYIPDIWSKDQNLDYIPCLETMGEYEAANTWSDEGLKERQEHPLLPLSMLSNPSQGHFAATREKIGYLAFYIKKAMQYRLPKKCSAWRKCTGTCRLLCIRRPCRIIRQYQYIKYCGYSAAQPLPGKSYRGGLAIW